MKDYRKKVVSAVLAAAIAFSSVGVTAYAEEIPDDSTIAVTEENEEIADVTEENEEEIDSEEDENVPEDISEGESGKVLDYVDISINETNFPDRDFRSYIKNNIDKDKDGYLSPSEIQNTTNINVSDKGISDLKGIEYFTALTVLYCCDNKLTSLDVSNNTALTDLKCYNNKLTSLDVSNNTALTYLSCACNNQLTSLDVSNNTALTYLSCAGNQHTSLDVSNNTALEELDCSYNQLTSLDVSKNTALEELYCSDNQLTSLDVSKNTLLTHLYCSYNKLTALNLRRNINLEWLYCDNNNLTSLDISKTQVSYPYDFSNNTLDMSTVYFTKLIENGFDYSKVTKWSGAEYNYKNNSIKNITSQTVQYTYDVGNGETATFTLNMQVPEPPTVTAKVSSKTVLLSWNDVSRAIKYNVYVKENGTYKLLKVVDGTEYIAENLTDGKEYTFLVRAVGDKYLSDFAGCSCAIVTPNPPPPSKPTNVKATAGDKQVTLSWTASTGAANYTIYKYSNGTYTKLSSTTKTSCTVTGLTNGTTYKFLVRAFNANGGSSFTSADLVTATPQAPSATVPAKPIVSADVRDKVVTFSWYAVEGATYYNLYNYSNGKYGLIATTTDTSYRLRYLKNGTTYKILVRAFNANGGSAFTAANCITVTPKAATAVPSKATVSATVSNGNINLTWAHVPTAFSYTIYKYENGKYTKLGATCDNFFTVKGLKAGKAYNILVRAFNSKGGNKFALSDLVSVTL